MQRECPCPKPRCSSLARCGRDCRGTESLQLCSVTTGVTTPGSMSASMHHLACVFGASEGWKSNYCGCLVRTMCAPGSVGTGQRTEAAWADTDSLLNGRAYCRQGLIFHYLLPVAIAQCTHCVVGCVIVSGTVWWCDGRWCNGHR